MRNVGKLRATLLGLVGALLVATASGCSITSPYWGYTPASTSAPIPFQAWNISTSPLYVECANDTTGHGSPTAGEASYIPAATLSTSTLPSLDSLGQAIYSASKNVTLPAVCWKFHSYSPSFWQANVRVVTKNADGSKSALQNFDLQGLECLGRENGRVARWNGHVGKNCEHRFSNTNQPTPYIVLRIYGSYERGLRGPSSALSPSLIPAALPVQLTPDVQPSGSLPTTQVYKLTADDVKRLDPQLAK